MYIDGYFGAESVNLGEKRCVLFAFHRTGFLVMSFPGRPPMVPGIPMPPGMTMPYMVPGNYMLFIF